MATLKSFDIENIDDIESICSLDSPGWTPTFRRQEGPTCTFFAFAGVMEALQFRHESTCGPSTGRVDRKLFSVQFMIDLYGADCVDPEDLAPLLVGRNIPLESDYPFLGDGQPRPLAAIDAGWETFTFGETFHVYRDRNPNFHKIVHAEILYNGAVVGVVRDGEIEYNDDQNTFRATHSMVLIGFSEKLGTYQFRDFNRLAGGFVSADQLYSAHILALPSIGRQKIVESFNEKFGELTSPIPCGDEPEQEHEILGSIAIEKTVGTAVGDIGLWKVGSGERLGLRDFKVWDLNACSVPLQAALVEDPGVSVNHVIWSPYGSLFGVAYLRDIVQIYSYHGNDEVRHHLEIDVHVGGVNDLAFSTPKKQLCVITCGDDKTVKVWDAGNFARVYTFEGHEAPVYSVCLCYKENIQFIFSTALDGNIKAWLYDNLGSRVDYEAPGRWCTAMAYSADGTRLFSRGTSKDGESYVVWNESEGAVKRTYHGFRKCSLGAVQFNTTKNQFLAAGDDFSIKFWDMDNVQLLTTTDAHGGLPASPSILFNKDGILLALSANENGIKILANSDGMRMLHTFENCFFDASRASEVVTKPTVNPISAAATSSGLADRGASTGAMNEDVRNRVNVKPRITEESNDKSKIWKLTEISEQSQCCSLRLPENMRVTKISRLIYTNSGNAKMALASNAIHLLWKWQRSDRNSSGKATAGLSSQLWQASSGILMTNDITDANPEEAVPCFAWSKNDSFVMTASC